jgi:membrane protein CcdC involved in cytochrome C biogenesis
MKNEPIQKALVISILIAIAALLIILGATKLPIQLTSGILLGVMMSLPVLGFVFPFLAFTWMDIGKTSYWVCFFGPLTMMSLALVISIVPSPMANIGVFSGFLGSLIILFLINLLVHYRRMTQFR